jgi:hypothetical protein
MYYKKQHGRDVAYLKPLEYTKDVEMMLEANERKGSKAYAVKGGCGT